MASIVDSKLFNLKMEVLRLASPEAGRQMMRRRWEAVIKMRDELCLNWTDIAEEIERAPGTAKALYERGWVVRQRGTAVCGRCLHKLTKVKTLFRQKKGGEHWVPSGKRVAFIYRGHCPDCKTDVWSKPMKPFSFEFADVPLGDHERDWQTKHFYGHSHSQENVYPAILSGAEDET